MYIIKKNKHDSTIMYMEYDDDKYVIKNKNKNGIHVDTISLYDKKYITDDNKKVIHEDSFKDIFNKLTNIIFNYLYNDEDDTNPDTTSLLIGEVDRLNNELESKYKEFIKREEYYDYLNKLSFLKQELVSREQLNKYRENLDEIISSKSR